MRKIRFSLQTLHPGIGGSARIVTAAGKALIGHLGCHLSLYIDDVLMDDRDIDHLEPRDIQALEVWHGKS